MVVRLHLFSAKAGFMHDDLRRLKYLLIKRKYSS